MTGVAIVLAVSVAVLAGILVWMAVHRGGLAIRRVVPRPDPYRPMLRSDRAGANRAAAESERDARTRAQRQERAVRRATNIAANREARDDLYRRKAEEREQLRAARSAEWRRRQEPPRT